MNHFWFDGWRRSGRLHCRVEFGKEWLETGERKDFWALNLNQDFDRVLNHEEYGMEWMISSWKSQLRGIWLPIWFRQRRILNSCKRKLKSLREKVFRCQTAWGTQGDWVWRISKERSQMRRKSLFKSGRELVWRRESD